LRCEATTEAGRPCKRQALAGERCCHAHAGEGVGRPDKLSPELRARLVEAVRAGCTWECAADYASISRSTLHRWLARAGELNADPRFNELRAELRKAEAEAELYAAAVVKRAMDGDWRAAIAYLERRHPERWGRRSAGAKLEHHQPGEAEIDVSDPAVREALSEVLRKGAPAR
jgi:transposase